MWGRWRMGALLLVAVVLFLPLLISVSELHRRKVIGWNSVVGNGIAFSNEVSGKAGNKRKLDHLLFGPAAGQGLSDRLHCQGLKALNQTRRSIPSESCDACESVSFVAVFTLYNSSETETSDRLTVGNVSYDKSERSIAILHAYIDFIQVSMPTSNVVILTDPAASFQIMKENTSILPIKGDYSRGNLMLQRITSYIEFLEKKLSERAERINHFIFTDSDIAVVDDLGHIFVDYPNFHVALTFRNNKNQPINSGFIAVRGTREGIRRGKLFLQMVLEVYTSKYMRASRMLGDQLALAWIMKSLLSLDGKEFSKPKIFMADLQRTSILFLPCALYNWTPPEGAGQFHGMPLDIKIVHFKGSRKRLMLEAWNFFNSSANLPDMLCLILLSGRTKYDF
ncbi:polyphosphatidylinositol phosphatase [Wolffia australiana]